MKKVFAFIITAALAGAPVMANAILTANGTETVSNEVKWKKSETGTWQGKGKVWYKLDDKGSLWMSKDGKKWEKDTKGYWEDKEGRWVKIGDKKLWWSTDGKNWSEVPEWKWEGGDGVWYKFDENWGLWVATS